MAIKISQYASLHTPRLVERRKDLGAVFSVQAMEKVWKDYVRPGLRAQEVLDLFDYNDFHWNKSAIFEHLSQSILDGRYKPSQSNPHRLEKKLGVCRTVILPSPEDAVALQCISEYLLPKILPKQPSRNAFFSRSHSRPKVDFEFGADYIWFKRWRKFSKHRISIATQHNFVVTTDVSTFYDNINYRHLRNLISELDGVSEVVLDVLFLIIDSISWRPDYLPSMEAGLPQVQFDAPRLLAHIYLFEIDEFLRKKTSSNFVRWVDDITFAVDSPQDGKAILRDVDALMQLRGIRLNSGKTTILSTKEAYRHFCTKSNRFLDGLKKKIEDAQFKGKSTKSLSRILRKSFTSFKNRDPHGHSDKIIKGYVSLFSRIHDNFAVRFCIQRFSEDPSFRATALRYFKNIPYENRVLESLLNYLQSDDVFDDASICQVAECLTTINVPVRARLFKELSNLPSKLTKDKFLRRSYFYFIAAIWISSKYSNQKQLKKFLQDTEDLWSKSEFLSRQVAASAAKFRVSRDFNWISIKIERHGFSSAISVINSLRDLQDLKGSIPPYIKLYCTNGNKKGHYSIQRFLVTFRVASSQNLNAIVRNSFIDDVLVYIEDPHYVRILRKLKI